MECEGLFFFLKIVYEHKCDEKTRNKIFAKLVQDQELTEKCVDYVRKFDANFAARLYQIIGVPDKLIDCLKETQQFPQMIRIIDIYKYPTDYSKMIVEMKSTNLIAAKRLCLALITDPRGNQLETSKILEAMELDSSTTTEGLKTLLESDLASAVEKKK